MRIFNIGLFFVAMGLLSVSAYAAEPLSDGEMDGIVAGFLDAKAVIDVNAASKADGKDGSQVLSGSVGSFTGAVNVPLYNGLTVKNDDTPDTPGTQPGAKAGGHVAAAHFIGAQAKVDSRNVSNHQGLVKVNANGDSAAAHGAGSTAIHRGDRGDKDEPSGHGSKTALLAPWKAQGHGNKGSSQQANEEGEVSVEDKSELSEETQKDIDVLFGVNSLDEVGNGFNATSTLNETVGNHELALNAAVQATDQDVYNFSEVTSVNRTVGIVPVNNTVSFSAAVSRDGTKN